MWRMEVLCVLMFLDLVFCYINRKYFDFNQSTDWYGWLYSFFYAWRANESTRPNVKWNGNLI